MVSNLLEHLRARLNSPRLSYAESPTPITGGYDTRIFAFRLRGAPEPWAMPLILRVLGRQHPPTRALRERAIQNAVAGLGYPAPRVLLATTDLTILGGAFLVMERLAGRPLLSAQPFSVISVLVEMQLRLHALDAEVLLEALDREGRETNATDGPSIDRELVTFEGHLARLERQIVSANLRGLEHAMTWLLDHRPTTEQRRVICHGDFHPQNILMADRRVTGVIDWPNATVADPAFDVASTRVILSSVPLELLGIPPVFRSPVEILRRAGVTAYVRSYRRRRTLDSPGMAYHEALACMRGLVRTAAARLAPGKDHRLNPLDASIFGERLARRFARITGVGANLPVVPRSAL